jgi:hypothetical protein
MTGAGDPASRQDRGPRELAREVGHNEGNLRLGLRRTLRPRRCLSALIFRSSGDRGVISWAPAVGPSAFVPSMGLHERFDRLSDIQRDQRISAREAIKFGSAFSIGSKAG